MKTAEERAKIIADRKKAVEDKKAKALEDREAAKASENMKAQIIKNFGPKGWDDFLKSQSDIKRIAAEDAKSISKDTAKIHSLFWCCMIAALIVAYAMM